MISGELERNTFPGYFMANVQACSDMMLSLKIDCVEMSNLLVCDHWLSVAVPYASVAASPIGIFRKVWGERRVVYYFCTGST